MIFLRSEQQLDQYSISSPKAFIIAVTTTQVILMEFVFCILILWSHLDSNL